MSIKTWFIATRPWSLVMTFVSTCLAGVLAYNKNQFSIHLFIITMIGLLIAHIAANMTNDWYDIKHNVDQNSMSAKFRPHPLMNGQVDKKNYKRVIFGLYGIGFIIALYLTWIRGLPILAFSILGVVFGVFYTADPVLLKHRSLGEISVFLAFGPLMVGGAFYALTGKLMIDPMLASIPIGLLVVNVLLSNNIRDKEYDEGVGISTIATGRSTGQGVNYYKMILYATYLSTILLIIFRYLSPFSIISFLTLKEAMEIIKTFTAEIPPNSDQISAQLALHYGVLLTIGEILNVLFINYF